MEADPADPVGLRRLLDGAEAVVHALGVRALGPMTVFSDTTRALVEAMEAQGVRRLVAITGVGAGRTRGRGGLVHDRPAFPFPAARLRRDEGRRGAPAAASGLDRTILRPAPFSDRRAEGTSPWSRATRRPASASAASPRRRSRP